ncbi:MAG: hypothetical protein JJT78_04450 [Leptospira sp.]|nr:hypothetical protein [Leptospira sp.]
MKLFKGMYNSKVIIFLIFIFAMLPIQKLTSDEREKPYFINSISFSMGESRGMYSVPSIKPINRSFNDAFASDGLFVPQYYRVVPYLPQKTSIPTKAHSLAIQAETTVFDLFYIGLGIGYKNWRITGEAQERVQQRNNLQTLFFRDLNDLNRIRVSAFTNDSFILLTEAYWLNLNLRFPIPMKNEYFEPYLNLEAGAGSCIKRESCNLARYAAGVGFEWIGASYEIRPFLLLHSESLHQERPRASYVIRENGFQIGVRLYNF